jgi:3-oxoacyl-[acyl-carrier protein] reductase
MFNLTGKQALITGATGGIGKAIATLLHKNGADVILTGTREEVLKQNVAELGERASYLVCNLSDKTQITDMISKIEGAVDILVCNAGITRDNLLMRMKDEEWQDVIDVNLTSAFTLIKGLIRGMLRNKSGRIINITSVVGVSGNPGQANYCASKAGIIGLTKSIAQEFGAKNITANSIAPGFIATDMTEQLTDQQKEAITQNIPAGKLGTVDDIAAAALFLASDEASYITGQTLHINGGMLMP